MIEANINIDPPICATCHQQGDGCCHLSAEGVRIMFGLTNGEVAVMAKACGLPPEAFTVSDEVDEAFLRHITGIHPVFGQTMPGGSRIRLKVDDSGACIFLGPQGCTLPTEARPLYCRLYPFWFTPDDRLMVLGSSTCLAQENARNWKEVLARLAQNIDELRELFARLCKLAAEHEQGSQT